MLVERQEHDGLVDTVEKLRAYGLLEHLHHSGLGLVYGLGAVGVGHALKLLLYELAAEVGRHYYNGVLEVDRAPLVVGEPPVVEHLKQDVEHVGVSLFNLVEQHYRVGLAPYGLGELASLVVAHVSRRRTDEPRHAELFLIFAHVYSRHHRLVVEQILGQSLCQLGLAHARGAEEYERGDRPLGVLQSGAASAHGIAHGTYGFFLSYHAFVQLFLQVEQFFALALHHPCHGYARPPAHHFGYVVGRNLLAHHGSGTLRLAQLLLDVLDVVGERLQLAVPNLSHTLVVALTLGTLSLQLQVFYLLLVLLNLVDESLFALPFCAELFLAVTQFGYLLVELFNLLGVVLALDGLALNFQLLQLTGGLVKLFGHRVALHAQLGGGLVHQVDGLVGQETVADVPFGQLHGGYAGVVLDAHLVVVLVAFLQSAQYAYGAQLIRLVNSDGLETTLQSLVLLEILLVFVQCSGSDAAQFAARKGWFQYVGGVHGSLTASGSHQCVYLVDEENDASVALGHLVNNTFEPLLKLALVLRPGHKRTHVERIHLLVLKVFGHIAAHDALGQTLDYGRLARAGFTYQDRVVLGASAKYLQHAAYLVVTTDNGVELALPGLLHKVLREAFQTLIVVVSRLRLHLLSLAQFCNGSLHVALGASCILQNAACCRVYGQQGEHYRLHADELVAHFARQFDGFLQHGVGVTSHVGLSAALHPWQVLHLLVGERGYLIGVHPELAEQEVGNVLGLYQYALEQMHRFNGLLAVGLRYVDGLLHHLLCLDSEFVECHILVSFLVYIIYIAPPPWLVG